MTIRPSARREVDYGAIHFSSITFRIRYSRLAFFCRLIFILVDEKKMRALATYITRADTREREREKKKTRRTGMKRFSLSLLAEDARVPRFQGTYVQRKPAARFRIHRSTRLSRKTRQSRRILPGQRYFSRCSS